MIDIAENKCIIKCLSHDTDNTVETDEYSSSSPTLPSSVDSMRRCASGVESNRKLDVIEAGKGYSSCLATSYRIEGRNIKRVTKTLPLTFKGRKSPQHLETSLENFNIKAVGDFLGFSQKESEDEFLLSDSRHIGFCLSESSSVNYPQAIEEEEDGSICSKISKCNEMVGSEFTLEQFEDIQCDKNNSKVTVFSPVIDENEPETGWDCDVDSPCRFSIRKSCLIDSPEILKSPFKHDMAEGGNSQILPSPSQVAEKINYPLIYDSDSSNEPSFPSRSRSLELNPSFNSDCKKRPRRQTIATSYVCDSQKILTDAKDTIDHINSKFNSLGVQSPFRSASETFPPFGDLHHHIKLNITRNVSTSHNSNFRKQKVSEKNLIEKINITDNSAHSCDTSRHDNNSVSEKIRTIKKKLVDSKKMLSWKSNTRVVNSLYGDGYVDKYIDDATFLGNFMYYFTERDILTPTSLCLLSSCSSEFFRELFSKYERVKHVV